MTRRIFPISSRVAFAILLPIAAYNAWDYVETKRYEARLSAIGQKGELTTPVYLPTGDWVQAERYYRAAAALLVSHSLLPGVRVDAQSRVFKAVDDGQWTPEAIGYFRASVESNREALGLVDRASAVPFGGFRAGTSYNYLVGDLMTLARLCEIRAVVSASDGNGDAAIGSFASEASLVRALDFGNPVGRNVPTFARLSAVMERTKPSLAARESAERAFAAIDHDDRHRRVLLQYRVSLLSGPPLWLYEPHPLAARDLVRSLDGFAELLAASGRPWPERINAMNAASAWPAWPSQPPPRERSRLILNDFVRVTAEQTRRIRCARLLLSMTPLTLIDPFTGKPLETASCHL